MEPKKIVCLFVYDYIWARSTHCAHTAYCVFVRLFVFIRSVGQSHFLSLSLFVSFSLCLPLFRQICFLYSHKSPGALYRFEYKI